jgi:hypothetical protein
MKPIPELGDQEFEALARKAAAMPDAPPALVRTAIDLWQTAKPLPLQAIVRRIAAALSFDSWTVEPTAVGVRALPSDARHLLFSAMGRDLDLRITPSSDGFALTGQVLGPDEAGEVRLESASGGGEPKVAALDALGEFRLEGIARGSYLLTVHVGGDEIALPPIEVGDRSA